MKLPLQLKMFIFQAASYYFVNNLLLCVCVFFVYFVNNLLLCVLVLGVG